MSAQAKRNPLKRPKDVAQGNALLDAVDAVDATMPQYPLDEAFDAMMPGELAEHYRRWKERRPARQKPGW